MLASFWRLYGKTMYSKGIKYNFSEFLEYFLIFYRIGKLTFGTTHILLIFSITNAANLFLVSIQFFPNYF